jgi:hypothetical protein
MKKSRHRDAANVRLHTLITSELDSNKSSTSRSSPLYSQEHSFRSQLDRDRGGLQSRYGHFSGDDKVSTAPGPLNEKHTGYSREY